MTLVAPAPVGAPLAMSTLGAAERSSRAPPTPSITQRKLVPSNWTRKQVSTAVNSSTGRSQDFPPSNDRIMMCLPLPGMPTANWLANTYTTPWLSVRTVQPERPKPCFGLNGLFDAGVTCLLVHVLAAVSRRGHDQRLG